MRQFVAAVVLCGMIAPTARAQYGPGAAPYSAGAVPVVAHTAYDESQQSVFIVDEPATTFGTPGVAAPATGGVYLASATMPDGNSSPSLTPLPPPQFQLLNAPRSALPVAPVQFSTIETPYLSPGEPAPQCLDCCDEPWHFQILPQGLIWHSYLAGPKEPRFEALIIGGQNVGEKFDGQVGGRVGLFRYGDSADYRPQGWQVDVEGGAIIREDEQEAQLVDGYDFRIGIPVTYGWGNFQMKISWYHTSAHLGDEFMLAHPTFPRINYSRNAIVWGLGYFLTDDLRVYGEIDYGYWTDGGNEPWAFQFGWEYSPVVRGWRGGIRSLR